MIPPSKFSPTSRRPRRWQIATLLAGGCASFLLAQPEPQPAVASQPLFREEAKERGLEFHHVSGKVGELYFNEMMGAGVALLDFDNDLDLDLYFAQGYSLAKAPSPAPGGRLFRNDLTVLPSGERQQRFVDVTEASGLRAHGYGMGAFAADLDDDGRTDLLLTGYDGLQWWRNRGDGTFTDATASSGLNDARWSVPACFLDVDRDGDLDVFVGHYVDYTIATNKRCTSDLGEANYCGPLAFKPLPDVFFLNQGQGRFDEVGARFGLGAAFGGALGALSGEFNGDGWLDVYVGNDSLPNQLWINRRGKSFANEALLSGVAVNGAGEAEASMGMDAGDYDNDGDEDIYVANLTGETNVLYANLGDGLFEDRTAASRLGPPSLELTGFGAGWLDFDNDGRLDLVVVNGAVRIVEGLARAGDPHPLRQRKLLFRGQPDGTFSEIRDEAGDAFAKRTVGRGAALGDLDNDGDTDIVVSNNDGEAELLVNQVGSQYGWLGLRVLTDSGRDAEGAWVRLERDGKPMAWRRVRSAASYGSSKDPRLLFGLGASTEGAWSAFVEWPEGTKERFANLTPRQYGVLRRGAGEPVAEAKP